MKKIFSLIIVALVCAGMYATTYTVAGSSSILGSEWSVTDTNNDMELVDDLYTLVKTDVTVGAGTYEYKVVADHAWANAWPGSNAKLTIDADGKYDITFTFNESTKAVNATATKKGEAVVEKHYLLVGDAAVANGKQWDNTAEVNLMTTADEGLTYTLTIEKLDLAAKAYEYKIVEKGTWNAYFDNGKGGNASFTIAEQAIYTIEYEFTVATGQCVVTATKTGESEQEVPEAAYYLVGSEKGWTANEANKFAATDVEGEYKITATLANDETIKVLGVLGDVETWYPDGEGTHFTVTEAYAGEKTIYFRPAGKDEWKEFHTGGFFYIEKNEEEIVEPTLANGYYLITEPWTVESLSAEALFTENENQAGEYLLTTTLAEGDSIKVVAVANDAITTWYPEGKNIAIDAKHAGEKTIYFRPVANDAWKEFHESGLFWIDATPDPVEEGLWKATAETPVDAGSVYIDNNLLKVEGVYLSFIAGTSHKYSDELDFKKALQIRTNGYPTEENKNAAEFSASEEKKHGTSLILTVKEDIDITFYYRRQSSNTTRVDPDDNKSEIVSVVHEQNDSKDLCVFDQAAITTKLEGIYTIVDGAEEEYAFATKKVSLKKDHVYTLTASGTTLPLFGIQYEVTPTFVDLQLAPGVWTEHDAILAAWVWQTGKNGNWVVFEGEGDTLSAKINEKADSVIFVRFADTVTVLRWDAEGDTVIWNRTEEQEIADCRLFFVNGWDKYSWCEAVEPPTPATEDGYYLVGSLTDWTALKDYRFTANGEVEGEYFLETSLTEGDEFKIAELKDGNIADEDWYLSENHVVTAEEAGAVTIYFRPDGQGGEDWIEGIIYIDKGGSTAIDNTAVGAKAVKMLQNGQLLITRDGKTYTVIGTRVR